MQKLIILFVLVCSANVVAAQSDSLYIKRGKFFQGTHVLTMKEMKTMMASEPAALAELNKAGSNAGGAQVLGFIGGFMIGWPIGTALGGGDAQWGLAAGGAAVLLLTIPLSQGFNKHATKAIQLYNNRGTTSSAFKPTLYMSFHGTGAKLSLKF